MVHIKIFIMLFFEETLDRRSRHDSGHGVFDHNGREHKASPCRGGDVCCWDPQGQCDPCESDSKGQLPSKGRKKQGICRLDDDEGSQDNKKEDNRDVRSLAWIKEIGRIIPIQRGQDNDPYHEKPLNKIISVIFAHEFLKIFPDAPGH